MPNNNSQTKKNSTENFRFKSRWKGEIDTTTDAALKWQKQDHNYRLKRRIIIILGVILGYIIQHYLA